MGENMDESQKQGWVEENQIQKNEYYVIYFT